MPRPYLLTRGRRARWLRPLLAAAVGLSGAARAEAQRLQFRQLTPDDGLSGSLVQSIAQDSRGFVWLGTRKGLNRYDGVRFTVYRHRAGDSTSLADNDAVVAYEDARRTLWVGTAAGVSRYDREHDAFVNYEVAPGDSVAVSAIAEAAGALWLGTANGLYTLDRATGKATAVAANHFAGLAVQALYEDRAKRLWVAVKDGGLWTLDPRTGHARHWATSRDTAGGVPGSNVRAFVEDAAGAVWMAVLDAGLVRFDPATGTFTRFQHDPADPHSLSIDAVHALLLDGTRGLWVGTENGGLDYLDFATRRFQHNRFDPNDPSGLNSNSVWSLLRDPSGLLWVGTFAGGVNVSRQNGAAIRRYRSMAGDPTSLSFNSVMGFTEDARGAIWVATDGGGLNRFDRATGRFTRFDMRTSGLNSDAVLAVTEDRAGKLWVATWAGGVSRFDPRTGRFTPFTTHNSAIAEDGIFAIHADRAGSVWVGTNTRGLQRIDPATGAISSYPLRQRVESQIRIIAEASDGVLFLGTDRVGLVEFDPRTAKMRFWQAGPGGISGNHVQAVLEAEPGVVWVGTSNGLDRLDRRTNRIEHFTEADGLAGAAVNGLSVDAAHRLWVSGDHGVTRFDPRTRAAKVYTVADGLQGSEFNIGAYYRARDGSILFGGSQGFNVLEPERIAENTHVPPVALTGFQLFNRPVVAGAPGSPLASSITVARELVLRHDQSVFTIEFAALDFAAPDKNRYAYKLEGLDRDWNEVGTAHAASYTNLSPGRYVFRVRGSNNDGVWSERAASIAVTISPPFWATWWFRALVLGAAAAGAWFLVRSARARRAALERAAERDRRSQQYLERNVIEVLTAMERFSAGDLTVALAVDEDDSIGRLRAGFNTAVVNIRTLVAQVRDVLDATVRTRRQIHGQTVELSRGAEEQIGQTLLVAGAAQQMAHTVAGSAQSIAEASEIAQRSGSEAHEGGRIVRDTFSAMDDIVSTIGVSARTVEALGRSSDRIGAITRVIEQIADQTELLSLNAAIEAARAGPHGRTFAVVAQEVQKLAEQTADATSEIARVIALNQREVAAAVETMARVGGQAEQGRRMVHDAGGALDAIIANAERMLGCIRQVRAASEEQSATAAHIGENVETISGVTHAAVAGNRTIASSVEGLNGLIEDLRTRVARFRFDEPAAAGA